jgi:hypothetical protein
LGRLAVLAWGSGTESKGEDGIGKWGSSILPAQR